MKVLCAIGILACALFIYADTKAEPKQAGMPAPPIHFTDVTGAAGILFTHNSGRAGKQFLP